MRWMLSVSSWLSRTRFTVLPLPLSAVLTLLFALMSAKSVLAQPGLADGQAFARGANGAAQAMGSISNTAGQAVVPNFASSSAEANYFANGRGALGAPAQSKISQCQTGLPSSAYAGQDCNAINHLRGQPSGWAMDGRSPEVASVLSASRDPIAQPSAYNGASASSASSAAAGGACRSVTRNVGATYEQVICSANMATSFQGCTAQLSVSIVNDYSCPPNGLSAPVDAPGGGKVCRIQSTRPKYRCEPGLFGPRDANQTLDEWGRPVTLGPPLWVCDQYVNSGEGGYNIVSTPAAAYDDIQIAEIPATKSTRQVDQWGGTCQSLAQRASSDYKPFPDCQQQSTRCTSGPETRLIDGVPVTRSCWETTEQYACQGNTMVSSCPAVANRNCTAAGSTCRIRDASGQCIAQDQLYSCLKTPAQTVTTQVCGTAAACEANLAACFGIGNTPDGDFAKAVAAMESSRQGGVYGGQFQLFGGAASSCTIKLLAGVPVRNCCTSQGGGSAFSNSATISRLGLQAAMTVATEAGKETMRTGTQYVYDALYASSQPEYLKSGLEAMKEWGGSLGDGVFNPGFSLYGFQFQFSFANGFEFTGFDPTSFAIAIGMQLIQQWLSCSQEDQMTMIKKGANLCVHVGTQCTSRFLGIGMCLEDTQTHCCFNSILAKVINRQGGAQIGRPPQQCGGFTEDEFQRIDFSKIDFSEFLASIGTPASDGSALAASQTAANAARLTRNYFATGQQR